MTVYVLRGGSMRPMLRPGALLLVAPMDAGRLYPGAMVVSRQDAPRSRLVAHRVVSVKHFPDGLRVVTQGDNAAKADPSVTRERLVGRVVAYWQDGRLRRTGWASDTAAWSAVAARRLLRRIPAPYRVLRAMGVWAMQGLLRAKQGVVFRREGDEALLFDPQSGEVKLLNETGAAVWEMLARGADTREIVEKLIVDFDQTERTVVARDVEQFVDSMRAGGMLTDTRTG